MPQNLTVRREYPGHSAIPRNPVAGLQQPTEAIPRQLDRDGPQEERGGELGPEPSYAFDAAHEDTYSQQLS